MQLAFLRRSFATIASLLLITAGSARAGGDPDHFLFYSTAPADGAPKFLKFGPVHLEDQFGEGDYEVQKPIALGLPADEAAIGLTNPDGHLQEFAIKAAKGTDFEKQTGVRVANQCSDVTLDATKPVSLMVPVTKRLQPPAGPVPSGADHYLCYKVKPESKLPKGMQVELDDQFQKRRYNLTKLTKLCVPADKSGSPVVLAGPSKGAPFAITPATRLNLELHLLCYQAKPATTVIPQNACTPWLPKDKGVKIEPKPAKHSPRTGVLLTGQFGTLEVDTKKEVELCIPSIKNPACGDGALHPLAGEHCDDGNTDDGDGCSAECLVEDPSPATDDLTPCKPQPYPDVYTFKVTAGQNVAINADTANAPTAADLCFDVDCPGFDIFADDSVPCTFPPPAFSCPQTSFTAPETGTCTIAVRVCSLACTSATLAPYALTVTRDNVATTLALRDDDLCGDGCAEFALPGTYALKVPKNGARILVDAFGAAGGVGRFGAGGGLGGRTLGPRNVTPGETLQINVGERGGNASADEVTPGDGGFNGGAAGGTGQVGGPGGGGGGASDVRFGGTTLADRVVVAAGGGGSGGGTSCCGGVGGAGGDGGEDGEDGSDGDSGAPGGGGADENQGGAAGSMSAGAGMSALGGVGEVGDGGGGGGGGGLFGGGGGAGSHGDHGGGGGGGGSGSGPSDSLLLPGEGLGQGRVRIILD